MRHPKYILATVLVFVLCLWTGFWIAGYKHISNDEFYSLVSSIHGQSYADIMAGGISEGNNAPLFYVLQKSFLHLINYHVPGAWIQGNWTPPDRPSQFILRVNPIVFMSLSVALVFYYFYRRSSFLTGLYSVFIYFSSYMIWVYWAEARPYALEVFLTTVQLLLFFKIIEDKKPLPKIWAGLSAVHILLSLTFVLSIGQVAVVSSLLWLWNKRDWKKYIMLTVVPVAIALFYYVHAPKYPFYFDLTPEQLIRDNISRERFYILFMFAALLGLPATRAKVVKELPIFVITLLMLAVTGALLCMFGSVGNKGQFPIVSRYFIYLMPVGVIAAVSLSIAAVKSLSEYRIVQAAVFLGIVFLLAQRSLKIIPRALHSIMGG